MANYTVKITGASNNTTWIYVEINGTKYTSATTVSVAAGTTVSCYTLDGIYITNTGEGYEDYSFEISADTEIYINGSDMTITYIDPTVAKDGHNANISDAAYEIEGGTVRYGGVAYEIESGMTLVGGVAYEISFKPAVCIVKITGTGNATNCYIKIGATKYSKSATIEVEPGTVVTLYIRARNSSSGAFYGGNVTVNGVKVSGGPGSSSSYSYTVNKSITAKLSYEYDDSSGRMTTSIAITES